MQQSNVERIFSKVDPELVQQLLPHLHVHALPTASLQSELSEGEARWCQ